MSSIRVAIPIVVLLTLCLGCVSQEEGEDERDDAESTARGTYQVGDSIVAFPEDGFSIVVPACAWSTLSEGRDRFHLELTLNYDGKSESGFTASSYFDMARESLFVVDPEHEFGADSFSVEDPPGTLMPREEVSGWILFEVPEWFAPDSLVARKNGEEIWEMSLKDSESVRIQRHASIKVVGPTSGGAGDAVVISVSNDGNVELRDWEVFVGEFPFCEAFGGRERLGPGGQRSFSLELGRSPPWRIEACGRGLGEELVSSTLMIAEAR